MPIQNASDGLYKKNKTKNFKSPKIEIVLNHLDWALLMGGTRLDRVQVLIKGFFQHGLPLNSKLKERCKSKQKKTWDYMMWICQSLWRRSNSFPLHQFFLQLCPLLLKTALGSLIVQSRGFRRPSDRRKNWKQPKDRVKRLIYLNISSFSTILEHRQAY